MSRDKGFVDVEQQELLATITMQANVAANAALKIKKLSVALSRLIAMESPQKQVKLLSASIDYLATIHGNAPAQLKASLNSIANELQSLKEGIYASVVDPEDLVVISLNKALKEAAALKAKSQAKLTALQSAADDPAVILLDRNARFRESMPSLEQRDFAIARSPVTFAFRNKQGHGRVGYLDKDLLAQLGFKAELLDGYCILHNQVVIGVSPDAVVDIQEKMGDAGKTVREPITIRDKVVTFKAGKPTTVFKKRPKAPLDVAKELVNQLASSSGIPYSLVNEHSASFKGGSWFWAMPTKDIARLSKAFPGGHINVSRWGFAFS